MCSNCNKKFPCGMSGGVQKTLGSTPLNECVNEISENIFISNVNCNLQLCPLPYIEINCEVAGPVQQIWVQ